MIPGKNLRQYVLKVMLSSLIVLLSIPALRAQEASGMRAGVELDVLPYITGGYFGAIWARKGHFGGRALFAKVNMPDFIVKDGFTNNEIRSYALVADYFLSKEQKGFWLGGGVVLWEGEIQSDQQLETATYQSWLLNGSLGYNINFGKRFYCSPWAGLSFRVGGDRNIAVDNAVFDPPLLNPELSVKFGFRVWYPCSAIYLNLYSHRSINHVLECYFITTGHDLSVKF